MLRKIISILLILTTLAGSAVIGTFAQEMRFEDSYTVGDVDASRELNGKDSAVLKTFVAGKDAGEISFEGADLNADGTLDAKDSYILKTLLSGAATPEELGEGGGVYRLLISGNDISDYCIVVPEGTVYEDNIDYAASEMQKYVEIATGTRLEICYGEENKTSPHAIVYHNVDPDSELGGELGIEGYRYDITNGDLNIYGTKRGNMYCTYVLLERIGFVFYSNDHTYVYERRVVPFEEGEEEQFVPSLPFRMIGETYGAAGAETHFFPRRLNGSQLYSHAGTRYGTLTGPHFLNAHSFAFYWRMATGIYTDDDHLWNCYDTGYQQPENAYDNNPWQPCASSDKEYDLLFLGMRRTMIALQVVFREGTSSMSFSICDNSAYCACRFCAKKARTEGYSGVYVDLTNRAARDIVEYYPHMKVMTIIYDHTIPETVRPESNVIIWFCGQGCNNHYFGNSEECGDNPPPLSQWHNASDEIALKAWADFCHEAGGEIWFWYYPGTYIAPIAPCPNVLNVYYDMTFVINECNVDGFYYEGGGELYSFAGLKAHMSSLIQWNPDMTFEEFVEGCKEYLYIYYGDGYELIWEYILMQTEAGNTDHCYVNNFNWPGKMYDLKYIEENYERMRMLITDAMEMTVDAYCLHNLELLLCTCDFIGLAAMYDPWYVNGDTAEKALYKERYKEHCLFVKANDIVYRNGYTVPDNVDEPINLWEYCSFDWGT